MKMNEEQLGNPDHELTVICRGKPYRNGERGFTHESRVANIVLLRHYRSLEDAGASSAWVPRKVSTKGDELRRERFLTTAGSPSVVELTRGNERVDPLAEMGVQAMAPVQHKVLMRCPEGCFDEQRNLTKLAPILDKLREQGVTRLDLYALAAIV